MCDLIYDVLIDAMLGRGKTPLIIIIIIIIIISIFV